MATVAKTRRTPGNEGVQARCNCEWNDAPWHDELLEIESAGFDGLVWLLEGFAAEGVSEGDYSVGTSNFEDFVARHNWSDPDRMANLAMYLRDICRFYRRVGAEGVVKVQGDPSSESGEIAELRRRLDAISPKLGEVSCKQVAVTDHRGRTRVRLYADDDYGDRHGLEVLHSGGAQMACLDATETFELTDATLMFNDRGNYGLELGVTEGRGPTISYAVEPGQPTSRDLIRDVREPSMT